MRDSAPSPRRRTAAARLLSLAGALLLLAALCAAPGRAARPASADSARLDRTIRFLQGVQNYDGGFGGQVGAPSDPLFSAWVAIALAAGGVNPRDQRLPGGSDVYTYVTRHAAALTKTTDVERATLVAVAAGESPRDFGGRDLVQAILARQLPSGAFAFDPGGTTGYVNATAFAILSLSTLHEPAVGAALRRGAGWLLRVQDPSGAWGYAPGTGLSTDTTASVIEALHAIGRTGTVQEQRAWGYIGALRNPDGGFGFDATLRESNSASTAWIVQAMWAARIDPARTPAGTHSPLAYLASMQQPDGAIRWKASGDLDPIWMTAYAAPAYGGDALPVTPVAREVRVVARAGKTTAVARRAPHDAPASVEGQGGFSTRRGEAIAGGGGRGAPLFSRPQPQSQGTRAGGARRLTPARTTHGGAEAGSGGGTGAPQALSGTAAAGGASSGPVTGVVIGDPRRAGASPAAPGLTGAQAGGPRHGAGLALAIAALLLLTAGAGAGLERRRQAKGALG